MKKIILLIIILLSSVVYAQNDTIKKLNAKADSLNESIKKAVEEKKSLKKQAELLEKKAKENFDISYIDTTQTVIYNFKTKEYKKSNVRPRVGEPLVFKITNINRLAYDVKIESEDVAIADEYFTGEIKSIVSDNKSSTTSEIITEANIPKLNINNVNLKKDSDKNVSSKETINKIEIYDKNIDKLEELKYRIYIMSDTTKIYIPALNIEASDKIIELNKKIDNLKQKTTEYVNIEQKFKDAVNNGDSLTLNSLYNSILSQDEINQITKNSEGISDAIEKIKKIKADELSEAKKDASNIINNLIGAQEKLANDERTNVNNDYLKFYDTFKELTNLYMEVIKKSNEIIELDRKYISYKTYASSPLLSKNEYVSKYSGENCPDKFIQYNDSYRKQINSYENLLNSFYIKYNVMYNDWDLSNKLKPESAENIRLKYQIIKNEVDKIKNAINPTELSKKYIKVMAMDKILRDEKCYVMVSSPIQPQEDYVTFKVNINHRDKNNMAEYNDNREFTYMEYTRGGVRFDFSTGVVIDMGFDNEKYGLRDARDANNNILTDKKQIVVTDRNRFSPNLAGMFHASLRSSRPLTFGLTLGASLNVETFQLNSIFPGISVLWGKKQKFIFTTGPAFKLVKSLKENYKKGFEDNTPYPADEFGDNFELTSDQYRIGWFIGITYNLTSKQRGKFKIDNN